MVRLVVIQYSHLLPQMVDDMVHEHYSLDRRQLDEMVDPDDEVLVIEEVQVQVVLLHNDLQVVHQIQVDDESDEVVDRVRYDKMDNFLQIREMVVLVLQIQYQEVQ